MIKIDASVLASEILTQGADVQRPFEKFADENDITSSGPRAGISGAKSAYIKIITEFEDCLKSCYLQERDDDWLECFKAYFNYICSPEIQKDHPCFDRLINYVEKILKHFSDVTSKQHNPGAPLKPNHSYHMQELFPYREKFLHLYSLKRTGDKLLDLKTKDGKTLFDRIVQKMPEMLGKIGLPILADDEIRNLLGKSWEPIAFLHDIGYVLDDKKSYAKILQKGLQKGFEYLAPDEAFYSEPYKKNTLHLFASLKNSGIPLIHHVLNLSFDTWKRSDLLMKNLKTSGSFLKEWISNPLSVLLAISRILTELPARICWRIEGENNCPNIPVTTLTFDLKTQRAIYTKNEYELSENLLPPEFKEEKSTPIDPHRVRALKEAFGPQAFNIFSKNEIENLKVDWDDNNDNFDNSLKTLLDYLTGLRKLKSFSDEWQALFNCLTQIKNAPDKLKEGKNLLPKLKSHEKSLSSDMKEYLNNIIKILS